MTVLAVPEWSKYSYGTLIVFEKSAETMLADKPLALGNGNKV